jgi:hypothetical protein
MAHWIGTTLINVTLSVNLTTLCRYLPPSGSRYVHARTPKHNKAVKISGNGYGALAIKGTNELAEEPRVIQTANVGPSNLGETCISITT